MICRAAVVLAENIFYNQGQICSAPSRVIVDASIKARFVGLLKKECRKYIPADPFDIKSDVGCVVSREQEEKIRHYIRAGIRDGAKMFAPRAAVKMHPRACYVLPTVFEDVQVDSVIAQEEIFGPVVVVFAFNKIEDAVRIANHSRFGLAASIWTSDLDEACDVSRRLQAGIVHINSYGDDDDTVPFGGIKESGIGKDKSIFAFDEYSYLKTTWIRFNNIE